nr:MAG TPA: hypothetical protein [Caudoviricetes sp.]
MIGVLNSPGFAYLPIGFYLLHIFASKPQLEYKTIDHVLCARRDGRITRIAHKTHTTIIVPKPSESAQEQIILRIVFIVRDTRRPCLAFCCRQTHLRDRIRHIGRHIQIFPQFSNIDHTLASFFLCCFYGCNTERRRKP